MPKTVFLLAALGIASSLQIGCATILVGKYQEVQVLSSPPGAKATTVGQSVTTPGTFTLRRDTNYSVSIEKDGYFPETVSLTSGLGPTAAGNVILGGLIGGGVDAMTGALYKLYPETVNVALRPVGAPVALTVTPAPVPPASMEQPVQGISPEKKEAIPPPRE